jgi:hypothetical protein
VECEVVIIKAASLYTCVTLLRSQSASVLRNPPCSGKLWNLLVNFLGRFSFKEKKGNDARKHLLFINYALFTAIQWCFSNKQNLSPQNLSSQLPQPIFINRPLTQHQKLQTTRKNNWSELKDDGATFSCSSSVPSLAANEARPVRQAHW